VGAVEIRVVNAALTAYAWLEIAMKLAIRVAVLFFGFMPVTWGQTNAESSLAKGEKARPDCSPAAYVVFGATADQEAVLRSQIQIMQPEVSPLRVFFVPHWKYVDAARIFRLRVPAGMSSVMFAHLPSRAIFIDSDRYLGDDWLGYRMAHELGHLAMDSVNELVADKAAREFRKRLKNASKQERYLETKSRIPEPIQGQIALLHIEGGETNEASNKPRETARTLSRGEQ
jgi:hypothetical protein